MKILRKDAKACIRSIALLCILALTIPMLFACSYKGYKGDSRGAYTLFYSQVPGVVGANFSSDGGMEPVILPIDTDDYGRVLYVYMESTQDRIIVGIVQKEADNSVYYYPETSTLAFRVPTEIWNSTLSEELCMSVYKETCTDNDIEKLKERNDWNKPISTDKLEKADILSPIEISISEPRVDSVNIPTSVWKKTVYELATENGHVMQSEYDVYNLDAYWMSTDSYGRRLYYVESHYYPELENADKYPYATTLYYLQMVAIINPDATIDDDFMVEILDMTDYHGQISDLKEKHSWNEPCGEEVK